MCLIYNIWTCANKIIINYESYFLLKGINNKDSSSDSHDDDSDSYGKQNTQHWNST